MTDRARRVVQEPYSRRSRVQSPDHPLRPPGRGLRGPLRCLGTSSRGVAGYPVLPLQYPPRYTPPCTHPARTTGLHGSHVTAGTVHGYLGACTYGRFGPVVGEPRGSRTHPVFRVPGSHITVYLVYQGLHGRLTANPLSLVNVLLSLVPVLLSLDPSFLSLVPVLLRINLRIDPRIDLPHASYLLALGTPNMPSF